MLLKLGKLLEAIRYDTLPQATVEKTKTAVLNFFGGSLAGADAPLTLAEKAVWERQKCSGNSVILGNHGKTSPLAAAAVNAAMGEIYLSEDCHPKSYSHPGMMIIPVAMAIGQSVNSSGKDIIEAIVTGYESLGRVGSVLITPDFARNGLRPASIVAPFGGAATVARLMGLKAEGIRDALSIAGNTSAGVVEFVNAGTVDICIQNCFAAKNSIMAGMLAVEGVQAAPTILDGRFGLGYALTEQVLDWSRLIEDTGGTYAIDDTFIKAFPGCGIVQSTAQAAMALVKKYSIDPENVDKVTVAVYRAAKEWPGVDSQGPFSGTISAMMSHQFMVSSALIYGEINVKTVNMYDHPDVAGMAQRVFVEIDENIEKAAPQKTGASVTIQFKNGETVSDFQEDVVPLDRDGVIDRLRRNSEKFLSGRRVDEIIEKTLNLEKIQSINSIMDLLESDK